MQKRPYCYQTILATTFACLVSALLPLSNAAADQESDLKVETAGERAHFAQAFCQVPPERVEGYKARLRTRLSDASDFDLHWQTGWSRASRQITEMSSLRERDPDEFAARIKVNCERLKWMAENSLRARAPK
jgi:hypothetical protein